MKKTIVFLSLILSVAALFSCANEEPSVTETPEVTQNIIEEQTDTVITDTETIETADETTEPGETLPNPPEYENIALSFDSDQVCTSPWHLTKGEGAFINYPGWSSTDYIDISGYSGIEYELAAFKNLQSVSFYDAEKKYISGVGTRSMLTTATSVMGIEEIPENAKYARFIKFNGKSGVDMPEYTDGFVHAYKTEAELQDALTLRPNNSFVIACLGDSLTEGDYGTTENKTNRHYKNYPYYLSKELGCKTVNFGMCGANAESFYRECCLGDRVDISDADVILIMIGTNRGLSGDYEVYYRNIISAVKTDMKDGATVILVAPPSATKDGNKAHYGWHPNVVDATNKVKELSESLELPMINAYALSPIQPHTEYKYQPVDGLHLSEDGYRAFAKFMAKEVIRLLELE